MSDFMMYIIAGKINGLDEIKAFYDCTIRLHCPVMMGILLERWILLVLQDKAVNMHHFVMYTDRDTGEGKISLRVIYTINYTNPDDLIDALNTYGNIIGIPEVQWNTEFDFLYMKFHNDKVIQMSFYQVTVAKSHRYNMKAMNAILDAFRECGHFELFVVEIFFVNHSKGNTMRLGTVTYEQKTELRCQQCTMYGGGEFPFPLKQDSVTQLYVTVVESKDLDATLKSRK